jgi:hypothetical protein
VQHYLKTSKRKKKITDKTACLKLKTIPHSKAAVAFRGLAIREFDHSQTNKQAKTGFKLIFDGLGIRGFRNVTPRIERKTCILNLFFLWKERNYMSR